MAFNISSFLSEEELNYHINKIKISKEQKTFVEGTDFCEKNDKIIMPNLLSYEGRFVENEIQLSLLSPEIRKEVIAKMAISHHEKEILNGHVVNGIKTADYVYTNISKVNDILRLEKSFSEVKREVNIF